MKMNAMTTSVDSHSSRLPGQVTRFASAPTPVKYSFAPIPETPVISAKIFEISKNVWGYDIAYLTRFCNIFSVLHKGRILTDALINELTCINKRKSRRNAEKYTMPQNRKRKFQKGE